MLLEGVSEASFRSLRARAAPAPEMSSLIAASRASLSIDGATVASGHQPGFWHAGILAKHLLCVRLASALRTSAIHLIADHDANEGELLRWPARVQGEWTEQCVHVFAPAPGVAWASRATTHLLPTSAWPEDLPWTQRRTERIVDLLRSGGPPAQRLATANLRLIAELIGSDGIAPGPPMRLLTTTCLLATPLGRSLVERAAADPVRVANAWNTAIAAAPGTARPLPMDGSLTPFWICGPGMPRRRATVMEAQRWLSGDTTEQLLPTAFIATGLARWMFGTWIHGTGGREYEQVADAFWRGWLDTVPPPFLTATATLHLPLSAMPFPSGVQAQAQAQSQAPDDALRVGAMDIEQLARNPELLLDERARAERRASAAAIEALPRASAARRALYGELRRAIAGRIALAEPALAALRGSGQRDAARLREHRLLSSREWGAWLHPVEALQTLWQDAGAVARAMLASS